MQVQFSQEQIEDQRKKVFGPQPYARLVRSCRVGDGILRLEEDTRIKALRTFDQFNGSIAFFIPASGSGSRMMEFLYEFRKSDTQEISGQIEQFINHLEDFAFFKNLPEEMQESIKRSEMDIDELIDHIISSEGLGLGSLPKGLIPFHNFGPFILNPFQEHLLQGSALTDVSPDFHFTIQKDFEEKIRESIGNIGKFTGVSYSVNYSEQSVESNSIAFNGKGEPYLQENGSLLTRPSGHGALLPILNEVNSDLILIKNIDNIQHFSKVKDSNEVWKMLSGMLLQFKNEAHKIYDSPSLNELLDLNQKYQLFDQHEIENIHGAEAIRELLNRPVRVCGMVRNEGQPGGGPFWIEHNGRASKQIIEKAQISADHDQRNILLKSTHFNPVMISASVTSFDGKKFDLTRYRDENAFFIVHKTNNGESVNYLEQPGLWNGSMANWITLFIEIPSSAFSPVKTLTDLIHPSHLE
jgi:hypothetical protein